MENSSDLLNFSIGLIIFLIILIICVLLYRKLICPIPERDSFIVKKYFLRDRYKYKRLIRYADSTIVNGIREYLLALNYSSIYDDENLYYLKNGDHEYFVSIDYHKEIIELLLLADSVFTLTKMSLVLEQILGNEELI